MNAEHRLVPHVQRLARTQVHVNAAGKARIEAADGPHDVDPLEFVGTVLFEDRHALHGIFVGPGVPYTSRGLAFQGVGG